MAQFSSASLPSDETRIVESTADFCNDGFICRPEGIDTAKVDAICHEWERLQASPPCDLYAKGQPLAVFWQHTPGEKKKVRPLHEFPELMSVALGPWASRLAKHYALASLHSEELRLLETIVFSKPPQTGAELAWHQDVAYFPFSPQNQIALWIPLDDVDEENGGLEYAVGSHRGDLSGPVDLHTGKPMDSAAHDPARRDPRAMGYKTAQIALKAGGVAVHDGRTWHRSLPNRSPNRQRRAISLRYLVGQTRYCPRPGTTTSMKLQIDCQPDQIIDTPAFPLV